jgi:hypothetical protein
MKIYIHHLNSRSSQQTRRLPNIVRMLVWGLVFSGIALAQPPADKLITYSIHKEKDKKSVQYIVIDLAKQAGLDYDWKKSFAQTDPLCRRFVTKVSIVDQPFSAAMAKILDPVGLRYEVEDGKVVLYRSPPNLDKLITYSTDQKSVQYIVIDLAQQAGLGYNWNKSFAQTDPECRRFVNGVSIKNKTFAQAIASVLNPVKLTFEVEDGKVVLYRR